MLDEEIKTYRKVIDRVEEIYEEGEMDLGKAMSISIYYETWQSRIPEDLAKRFEALLEKLDHLIAPEKERLKEIVEEKMKGYEDILNGTIEERLEAYVDLRVFNVKLIDQSIPQSIHKPLTDLRKEVGETLDSEYSWYKEAVDFSVWVKGVVRKFSGVDHRNVEQVEERVKELKLTGSKKLKYEEGCKMLDEMMEYVKSNIK